MKKVSICQLIFFSLVSTLLFASYSSVIAQEGAAVKIPAITAPAADATQTKAPAPAPLPKLPFEVPEGEIDLGTLFYFEQRSFEFTVKNLSEDTYKLTQIRLSCSCTKTDLKPGGVIGPHGELKVPVKLDTRKVRELGPFRKRVRLEFPGYQPVNLIFRGVRSREMDLLLVQDGNSKSVKTVDASFVAATDKAWEQVLELKVSSADARQLELGTPTCKPSHLCELVRSDDHTWRLRVWPRLPQDYGTIDNVIHIPIVSSGTDGWLEIPIKGMVGTLLDPSASKILLDEDKETEPVKKSFALTRRPFNFQAMNVLAAMGRPSPYAAMIPVLSPQELTASDVPGVHFEFEQGRGGVFVHCTMRMAEMSKEPVEATFSAPNSVSAKVTFGFMDEATKKRLAEEGDTTD